MKLTIHRGTNQIGGCVTEIESNGYRVFIDYGEQLPGAPFNQLSPIEGLNYGDVSKSALFFTHYHGDHIGKLIDANADLPLYIGKTASKIYHSLESRLSYIHDPIEAEKHKKVVERLKTIQTFEALQRITIGGITITPLFVDHSAFDAYMFIVEAENIRILHTGDFRGHGFRSKGLIPSLKAYAKNIDYIISEGSNILRPNATSKTEQELQKDFENKFRKFKYNFVLVSSTNIDRIFSMYHAAKAAKRCFICDSYQANILRIVSENHKQYSSFYDIDFEQKGYAGRFFEINSPFIFHGKQKTYLDNHGFCMLIRSNDALKPLLNEYATSAEFAVSYSMWKGYLDSSETAFSQKLYDFIMPYNPDCEMHTSGHADVETLRKVFDTVNPKHGIIPIHTEAPDEFIKAFPNHNIRRLQDKEVLEVEIH